MRTLSLPELYSNLRKHFGHQGWWPAQTRDEIIIGAILTQQTSWKNVEKAISNLREARLLGLESIRKAKQHSIELCIRPSGFYKQKAAHLKDFAEYLHSRYDGIDSMFSKDSGELRQELLSIKGIGKETADSIMLYVAGKHMFIIDAYTRRITSRIYGSDPKIPYDELRFDISASIPEDLDMYKDFHAQFVELGKRYCKKKPLCNDCPVKSYCQYNNKNG